jgi:hypothetical protein
MERVIAVKWPSMQRTASGSAVEQLFDAAFVAGSWSRSPEALGRLNKVVRYRARRIAAAHDAIPVAMCGVILTVSAFSLRLL